MPPKNSHTTKKGDNANDAITIDDINAVAASSVNGFLTNIAKGVRRAHAEGGKGTRRRVELYISTDLDKNKGGVKKDPTTGGVDVKPDVKSANIEEESAAASNSLFDAAVGDTKGGIIKHDGGTDGFGFGGDDDPFGSGDGCDWEEFDLTFDGGDEGSFDVVDLGGDVMSSSVGGPKDEATSGTNTASDEGGIKVKPDGSTPLPHTSNPMGNIRAKTEVGNASGNSNNDLMAVANNGADDFIPPPMLPIGHSMSDPAYEQMMADHATAVAHARTLRLKALRRTINKLAATVLHGKVLDRRAGWGGGMVTMSNTPAEGSGTDCEGPLASILLGKEQEVDAANPARQAIDKAYSMFVAAVAPVIPYYAAATTTTTAGGAAAPLSPNPFNIKPTHAPMWVTPDKDTSNGNPLLKALYELVSGLGHNTSGSSAGSNTGNTSNPSDAADNTSASSSRPYRPFFFDTKKWADVYLDERHAAEPFEDFVGRLKMAFTDTGAVGAAGGIANKEAPKTPAPAVGQKRPRSAEDSGIDVVDLDSDDEEENAATNGSEASPHSPPSGITAAPPPPNTVLFTHPSEYVLATLALLRAAGIPSRLVMAAEAPPPPPEADAVNLDEDDDDPTNNNATSSSRSMVTGGMYGRNASAKSVSRFDLRSLRSAKASNEASLQQTSGVGGGSRSVASIVAPLPDGVGGRGKTVGSKSTAGNNNKSGADAAAQLPPSQRPPFPPCSHYWIEVWDPLRQAIVSVNPIPNLTTRFGAPYTFAYYHHDHHQHNATARNNSTSSESISSSSASSPFSDRVWDVTTRYCPKYSLVYPRRIDKPAKLYKHLLWPDTYLGVKDYVLDRKYGPVEHLMVKVNELLNGTYVYGGGGDDEKTSAAFPTDNSPTNNSTITPNIIPNDNTRPKTIPTTHALALLVESLEDEMSPHTMAFGASGTPQEVAMRQQQERDDGEGEGVVAVGSQQIANDGEGDDTVAVVVDEPTPTSPPQSSSASWPPAYEAREQMQLEKLLYAEPAPTTLTDVKGHPLYVMEKDLQRHEAIYPKDKTTMVGTIRGAFVYKRSAVVSLRSRDGWLRESRSLLTADTQPYRVVPPPPSRPLAPPSKFYGFWQTQPFVPQPLTERGSIPRHGNTNWYMVLGAAIPPTLEHITHPLGGAVARRVNIEYRQAVMGFEKKEWTGPRPAFGGGGGKGGGHGSYEARIKGIIIKKADVAKFTNALTEYVQIQEEQEARRRSLRARNWWNAFAQRLVANDRMQALFRQGNAL